MTFSILILPKSKKKQNKGAFLQIRIVAGNRNNVDCQRIFRNRTFYAFK